MSQKECVDVQIVLASVVTSHLGRRKRHYAIDDEVLSRCRPRQEFAIRELNETGKV